MTRQIRTMSLAVVCCVAALALSRSVRADDPIPGTPQWDAMDLEGKWVTYQRAVAEDPSAKTPWAHWIGKAKDFAFLEHLVIYDGWTDAGPLLEAADAPQWIRAAFWALNERSSHGFDLAAAKVLGRQPGQVLAWVAAYPNVDKSPGAGAVLANLRKLYPDATPDEVLRALPPLDKEVVFAAMAPPPTLADFGTRKRVEPGITYVHQVTRAIRAGVRRFDAGAHTRDELLGLLHHPHEDVRQTAILGFAKLDIKWRPTRSLYYIANDVKQSMPVRESALLVLASDPSPAVRAWLADIVADRSHTLWNGAASALFTRESFLLLDDDLRWVVSEANDAELANAKRAKQQRWDRLQSSDGIATDVVALVGQAAWMLAAGHAQATRLGDWVVTWSKSMQAMPKVASETYRLRALPGDLKIRNLSFAPGATQVPTRVAVDKHVVALLDRIRNSRK